jgi:hypothetical protein
VTKSEKYPMSEEKRERIRALQNATQGGTPVKLEPSAPWKSSPRSRRTRRHKWVAA